VPYLAISRNVHSTVAYREKQYCTALSATAPEFVYAPLPTSVCSKLKAADRSVCVVCTLFPNSQQPHEVAL
jgi:hypothetical protein